MVEKAARWLSHTQIAMYLKCPRQYFFRYIMKIIKPPAGVLKQGGAFHKAAEHNYVEKMRTGKDVSETDVLEVYAEEFEREWEREEVALQAGESKGGFKDEGVGLVRVFHSEIAPTVQPVVVEDRFDYTFTPKNQDGGVDENAQVHLTGRIDVVDIQNRIRDNKTVNPRSIPNDDELATDLQLSIYSLARRMTTRTVESELTLDMVVKYAQPKTRILRTKRSKEMLEMTRNTIGMVNKGILNEVFPRHTNGWWCSKRWCGYYADCVGKALVMVDQGENLESQLKESVDRGEEEKGSEKGRKKGGQGAAQAGQKGGKETPGGADQRSAKPGR